MGVLSFEMFIVSLHAFEHKRSKQVVAERSDDDNEVEF